MSTFRHAVAITPGIAHRWDQTAAHVTGFTFRRRPAMVPVELG